MFRAYSYRLFPTHKQSVLLEKHFGCVRFIYNYGLDLKIKTYEQTKKSFSRYQIQSQLPVMKQEAKEWLSEVNAQSLQASLVNLEVAFKNFFKHKKGFPKFKKKNSQQSFQCPQRGKVDFDKSLLIIPKFKEGIKTKFSREFEGTIKTITIKRTCTNKYFASILVDDGKEFPNKKLVQEKTTIGIDVGIKDFCVLSNGEKIVNPRYLKTNLQRLKVLQRRASRKVRGSNNRKKANLRVAILHEKITNQRKDFLHKLSTKLIRENQSIAVEDLNVGGMLKNHNLAQSISDVSWSEFFRMLKYKSDWYGKNLIEIGRFDPSSKVHYQCGYINNELTLADRTWRCPICKVDIDRDVNAAQNIKHFALLKINQTVMGNHEELAEMSALVESAKQEVN